MILHLELFERLMYITTIHLERRITVKATVVDLRYKMNDVLKALDRNEKVTVLYRGKVKGILVPAGGNKQMKIKEHPFFGMSSPDENQSVPDIMKELRRPRYDDI
jgi:hypothetical protein